MAAPNTIPGVLGAGNHSSRPVATAVSVGAVYFCSTHGLVYQSDGATWSTVLTGGGITVSDEGTPLATAGTTLDFVGAGVAASGTGATKTITIAGGGSGGTLPLEPAASADAANDEGTGAASGTITGWTNIGTCAVRDRDTTIAGHIYLKANASNGTSVNGVYKSRPLANGEAFVVKLWPGHLRQNYNRIGLFIGVATPGACETFEAFYNGAQYLEALMFTNPTTLSSQYYTGLIYAHPDPYYFAVRRNSSTSYDYLVSPDGFFWTKVVSAHNPGFTQDACGLFVNDGAGGGSTIGGAFDWARFYTTLPGLE